MKSDIQNRVEYTLIPAVLSVLVIWLAFWLEKRLVTDFTPYGIYPRSIDGAIGILTSPLIHSGISHLWSNTVPVAVLTWLLFTFYPARVCYRVLFLGWFLSGLFTWMVARQAYHIGASGMVYTLASFIFFKGIGMYKYRHIVASLIVVFFYGSLVWYVLPVDPGISWEGHLCGAIAGLLMSVFIKIPKSAQHSIKSVVENPLSHDERWFLMQFDKNGNFSPLPVEELHKLDEEE